MLSLGSRDARKGPGLGFGVGTDMEENELEEGEASYYHGDDLGVDPDKDFSYLDKKLHEVLGHFQKDFEGGVSTENLGAAIGHYGSFLPSYQRHPSIGSHSRSPQRQQNIASVSPRNPSSEQVSQRHTIPEIGKHMSKPCPASGNTQSGSMVCFVNNMDRRDGVLSKVAGCSQNSPKHETISSSGPADDLKARLNNPKAHLNEQKTLKVRIKVGNDSKLANKNAAIYSGLGLDISPSSSLEESPDLSGPLSLIPGVKCDESPMMILQIMTSYPIPGVCCLSPLPESLLCLPEKEKISFKDSKLGSVQKVIQEMPSLPADETHGRRNKEGNQERMAETGKSDISPLLKLDVDIETPTGRELVSNALKISILSGLNAEKMVSLLACDLAKNSSTQTCKSAKEKSFSLGYAKEEMLESVGTRGIARNDGPTSAKQSNLKVSSEEKVCVEQKEGSFNDALIDQRKVGKCYDAFKAGIDGFKGRKEQSNGSVGYLKPNPVQKVSSLEPDILKMHNETEQLYGKKKVKTTISDLELIALGFPNESLKSVSSVLMKEKKGTQPRETFSETKNDQTRNCKQSDKVGARESLKASIGDINYEQAEDNKQPIRTNFKFRAKESNSDIEKQNQASAEKSKEKSGAMKNENLPKPDTSDPALVYGTSSEAGLVPTGAPVELGSEDLWVGCDRCQKWRLLPYHINPNDLPKKWVCKQMYWLPGMNKCSFSQEETRRAFLAHYQTPTPQDGSLPTMAPANLHLQDPAQHLSSHAVLTVSKKKHGGPKDTQISANNTSSHLSSSSKKLLEASVKVKSVNDVNQLTFDHNITNRSSCPLTSEQVNISMEKLGKQKEKHQQLVHPPDGGDYVEQSGKCANSKSHGKDEGEPDPDAFISSKKIKKEGYQYLIDDWQSDHEGTYKVYSNLTDGLTIKLTGNPQMQQSHSFSKDSKDDLKDDVLTSSKRLGLQGQLPAKYNTQLGASDMSKPERLCLSTKRRKANEWQENLVVAPGGESHHPGDGVPLRDETDGSKYRKEKKVKLSKSEGRECNTTKVDRGTGKKVHVNKIHMSSNRDPVADDMVVQKCKLDGADSLRRDLGYKTEPSFAATSSSSKVSGSQKSKTNLQEIKGSPVESVSSSPQRMSNSDKLTNTMRSDLRNEEGMNMSVSDGEDRGFHHPQKVRKGKESSVIQNSSSLKSNTVEGSLSLNPTRDLHNEYQGSGNGIQCSVGKFKEKMLPKAFGGTSCTQFCSEIGNVSSMNGGDPTDNLDVQEPSPHDSEGKDRENSLDKSSIFCHSNGSSQRKSNKSSSRPKDMHRSEKDKKVSSSLSEHGEPCKSGSGYRYEADFESYSNCPFHQNQREGKLDTRPEWDNEKNLGRKISTSRWECETEKGSSQSKPGMPKHSDGQFSPMVIKQQAELEVKSEKIIPKTKPQTTKYEDESERACQNLSGTTGHADSEPGRGLSSSAAYKQETNGQALRAVPETNKVNRMDGSPEDSSVADAQKLSKKLGKLDNQNGVHKSNFKHPIPDGAAGREAEVQKDSGQPASGVVKDLRHIAESAMREAKDLKHTADRVKNGGGQVLESTGLYFEAALKFLHVASVLEPVSADSAKHGEVTQSIQVYSDTAKLCEFCAHEYERHKCMAAACLAYKCMEVAYMRVVYSKALSTNKDRHELQSALHMLPPGESPSSSASDVDNLNNHSTVDKAAMVKPVISPQIGGNLLIIARNRPNFVRLLNFAQDMNFAMEAFRKSQNAFAVANANEVTKYGLEGMSSVRKVLDFNIHDVEGILRLVRVAMESIGR